MDLATVLEIKSRIEIAQSFAQEDNQADFKCETNREYRAFVKGQCVALEAVINNLQKLVEEELHGEENKSTKQEFLLAIKPRPASGIEQNFMEDEIREVQEEEGEDWGI